MSTASPASAPALDVNDLNFDTCERLRHLDWLLDQLGIGDGTRVLDVGGYPGYMARAFPRRKVVTADMYANGHPPYVKASGAALPFPDKIFDVTIACDVLEHVPPQYREAFLTELARVSARAVVVAGPYTTPGAARAEATVRTLLPESSPAQMWLAEHAECGLPSMDRTLSAFTSAGAVGVAALPVGSLTEWILFFAGQAAGERNHQSADAMKNFIASYNRLHTAPGVNHQAPAYRHAVVSAMDGATQEALGRMAEGAAEGGDPSTAFDRQQVEDYVDALGTMLRSVFQNNPGDSSAAAGSGAGDSLTTEYIQRLETMLSHKGLDVPPRVPDKDVVSSGLSQRLRAAWQVLKGY
jgi:hypothetical protein